MAQEKARPSRFLRLADELRGSIDGRSPLSVLRAAATSGLWPTWREQAELAAEAGISEAADPTVVPDFLIALTEGDTPRRVLDPWTGLGITVAALEAEGRVASGTAIEISQDVYEVIMAMRAGSRVDWLLGDAARLLPTLGSDFDLIVGSAPVNLPRARLEEGPDGVSLTASKSYTMLVQAAGLLAPQGQLAVVLPESFFGPRHLSVHDALEALGVYPSASLALPARGFAASIAMSLVLFSRERHGDLFLAELDSSADPRPIVANLRARRAGRLPQLGVLAAIDEFVSWRSTLLGIEVGTLARTMGLRPAPLADLCTAMHSPRREGEPFDPSPDAVYVPSIGMSAAVTSLDALTIKPQNYLQLLVRRDLVEPEYLAGFFNSSLGRKIREQSTTGTTIAHLTLAGLRAASAYLPPHVGLQMTAVQVERSLGELQQAISGLRRRLWAQPLQAGRVAAELRTLLVGDGLDQWRESLPFPLASVLVRYDAEEDAERKCRYLVNFFEATALTLVDLHLSAFQQDARELVEASRGESGTASYSRGSIGIWTDLLARLAKRTRTLVSKDPSLVLELFRVSSIDRLEAVSHKAVVAALKDEAATYRNNWVGHGPVATHAEWQRRLSAAEATLARIRGAIGDAFVGWELMRAGQGGNRGGVITTSVERLTGSQRAFRKTRVELREWPEEGALYMVELGATLPLRLAPLLTLQHGPASAEDACYFYDRLEGEGVRWVSYHFEDRPDFVKADASVVGLIAELNAIG